MEAQRYPISVRLIGVMHKEKSKMFMTSVLWSDRNDIVVYRTYPDFKKMHKRLKKAFPPASTLKKSDRIIPTFRGVNRGGRKKGPTRSLLCLKFLQKYCNELLSCDPRVSQSTDLIQFFHPKEQDLQPEFAKNSIMIMPSEDEIRRDAGQSSVGNVTQPFVTETYRCVALYETKDTKNKPFKVAVDEKLDVLIKDKAGWWLVENESKRMAWFPAPYLEKLDDDDDDLGDEDDIDGTSERGMLYNAVKSYKATKDDEITVAIGTVVEVLQKSDNGWWLIRYNGKAGYIPAMYLQPYNYPHIRMTANHPDRCSSPGMELQSNHLSLSQGKLLRLPPVRSSSPHLLQPHTPQRSRSVEILSLPAQPAASITSKATNVAFSPSTAKPAPLPSIRVEMDGEEEQRGMSQMGDSEGSLESYSSDYSNDLNSSWASSLSFNMTQSYNEQQLRPRLSPPSIMSNRLSPTSGQQGKMIPSVSDPNLYKGPTTPKVPPRPRAQEILSRCTTVTRKNATKGHQGTTQTEIMSR
ncbi:NADPH oxidase organizer 1a [Cottoperca gobio]|uniref:NADPH oxidase organizer 1a n=1 Tax=Cottoperca gobio TaxID=56716 RepID=A0A6J2Q890_COTGO|nr:NADPH oxidase organizer 1-like [Cottoperca gobio]